uniref:Ulp1 protease family, C-terminal catalytic domain-containing protein n=1 Tax=Tanacetum cinerariifolium TaxID=118510 RepID=A0A6L2L0P1_TANCI|nr:ulp1 protease family, C-terminal catalytic domain-containing protein [Tanacetum cinerariifolium]
MAYCGNERVSEDGMAYYGKACVEKEKAENRKMLIDLGPQIQLNRPQPMVDGYTCWMDHTDCVVPYTIHVGKEPSLCALHNIRHYVLFIICPEHGNGFILDPFRDPSDKEKSYRLVELVEE